ncbi:S-layer homology domain-containing protein [Paenibacillus motobuensis]
MALGAGGSNSDPEWPAQGSIRLNKTATPTGNFGEWQVTLTVEGKQLKTSTDIVLVIDKSGSMNDGKRLANAKEAAKSFADSLLTSDSGVRLAAVSFNNAASDPPVYGFADASKKDDFKKAIDKISATGGTNIQAGIKAADDLLKNSQADKKYIVLLSDGEPTYSYKGTAAKSYNDWPNNKYNFTITDFDFTSLKGTGNSFSLSSYNIGTYKVTDNGLPTISHAKLLHDKGIGIYSIGLEVGNNSNAVYVLNNSQNRGYYSANSDELKKVFAEISSDIKFAAKDAVVTDPMGEKFNLQPGALEGKDYEASQGEVVWNPATETFQWNVGTVSEDKPATLTYVVVIDPTSNPVSDTLYPTNGETTIDYTNVYGQTHVVKEFTVPEVKIGQVKILVKGYAVNLEGKPVDEAGNVVDSPDLAKELYSGYYSVDGKDTFPVGGEPVSVPANPVDGYSLRVGDDPTSVTLKAAAENIVLFGYAKVIEKQVTVKYVNRDSNKEIADPDVIEKAIVGEKIKLEAKQIPGYTAEEPTTFNYSVENKDNNEHIFYYTADEQSVTVKYLEKGSGNELAPSTSVPGKTGEAVKLMAVTVPGYTPEITEDMYTVKAEGNEYIFYYTQDEQPTQERAVTIHFLEEGTDAVLQDPEVKSGKVGDTLTWTAENITVTDSVYVPVQLNHSYTITNAEVQDYSVYYKKSDPEENLKLTIHYLDRATGVSVAEADTVFGSDGKKITLLPKVPTVTDAVYVPELESAAYTFTAESEQEYTFYYNKQVAERLVTVKYLEQGSHRQLANPTTVKGKIGDTLTLTAISISGYTPTKSSDTYKIGDGESQEYIFYYTANSTSPGNPSSGGSYTSYTSPSPSPTPPAPPVPPLPPVPPKLDTENHFDYIQGYPDGMVKPQNNISREEVAAIFYRLMEGESRANYYSTTNSYNDVKDTRWSNKHISTMANAGIITGYPDGSFRPGQAITRAEFAAIAARFDKLDERESGLFTDISGHWAEKYILSAGNKGWIKGYTDGTFRPNQYITRAEAMSFINSVLNRKVKESGIHKDAKKWPDNPATSWYYEDVIEATNNHDYSRDTDDYETWEQLKPHRVEP